jgi:mono/diheme cytochrome c family protein
MKIYTCIGSLIGVAFTGITGIAVFAQNAAPAVDNAVLAQKAQAILVAHCGKCHGATPTAGFSFRNRPGMLAKKHLVPGDAEHSRLYIRAALSADDPMPPATENNPLKPEEKALLKAWIQAGAPQAPSAPGDAKARKFVTTEQMLTAIADDLKQADERDRPFLRYFTLTHLYNAGAQTEEITAYQNALSKLLNSLSWQKRIVIPTAIEPTKTIFRIDMRKFSWTAGTWKNLLVSYPYNLVPASPIAKTITMATECELPFVRADWFVSNAARPPLYHVLLDMPKSAGDLEKKLLIDVEKDIKEETAIRAGFSESGVSRNNRIVERHESPYGAYWRSYDFSSSTGKQNIFQNPLGFEPAGGEIVFNLPNGMQGYMLVNGKGDRINNGPIEIVNNKTNPTDPIVRNGLTCMTCHTRGLKAFTDQVREVAVKTPNPDYDRNKCLALYGPKSAMETLFIEDLKRYADATQETDNEIGDTEPIALLSGEYEAPVSVARASAEVGMKPEEFLKKLKSDPELSAQFAVLLADNGAIKRDTWQEGFGSLSRNLALGTFTGVHTIVSSDGNGDYTTIGEAVRNARPGAQIYIRPGVYTEKIVLDKPVELVADGPAGSVTIQGTNDACIIVSDAKVKIRGLFVRGTVGPGIYVAKGSVEISDCDISSPPQPSVMLNEGANANIQHSVLHNGSQGILLANGSGAVITDCDIFNCSQQGVAVQPNGGHVLVQNSRIHDNALEGIWIDGGGRATLSECDIASSHDRACVGGLGANITIQACKIHNGVMAGVFMDKSHMTMDHSEVYANGFEGVATFNNSIVTVTTSKIRANHWAGCRIFSATLGIDDCDITDNELSGVDMKQGHLTIDNSRINHNGLQGVLVQERSSASVINSELHNNLKGPFAVEPTSRLNAASNRY